MQNFHSEREQHQTASCRKQNEASNYKNFILDAHTYILTLADNPQVDIKKKTCNFFIEIGFCYDVHCYFRLFDNFVLSNRKEDVLSNRKEDVLSDTKNINPANAINDRNQRLTMVAPEDMKIPFDILNASSMELKSESHFIRESEDGTRPKYFYTEGKEVPDLEKRVERASYLSEEKNMVKCVDINNCPRGRFWKHETKTFQCELSFLHTEECAPFNQIHLYLVLITANCHPGTSRIKFKLNKEESDFTAMAKDVPGFRVQKINGKPDMYIGGGGVNEIERIYKHSDTSWDRIYVAASFKRQDSEDLITYYLAPFLLFNYMIIRPIHETDILLSISSTLVIANVALLIVKQNNCFTYCEKSVLTEIIALVLVTFVLAYVDQHKNLSIIICISNFALMGFTFAFHYCWASQANLATHKNVMEGNFSTI